MGSVYARGKNWYVSYFELDGKRKAKPSGYRTDDPDGEKKARALVEAVEAEVKAGILPEFSGPMTLGRWFERRESVRPLGRKELLMARKHAAELLDLPLEKLTPMKLGDWVKRMNGAPRSKWHRWSNIRTALRDAVLAGHISAIPLMPPDALPPRTDADPTWRARAVFGLEEAWTLMHDERVPFVRRVLYAFKTLTGARHGEVVGLRWGDIDWTAQPLPCLIIAVQYDGEFTKTGATKIVPIHPVLNAILTAWRTHVTERDGRAPVEKDRVFTTVHGPFDEYGDTNDELIADLTALGFRTTAGDTKRRGGHDFRRTFVTELRRRKVDRMVRQSLTHPPAVVRDSIDGYDLVSYEDKCEAVLTILFRSAGTFAAAGPAAINPYSYNPATATDGLNNSNALQTDAVKTVFPN